MTDSLLAQLARNRDAALLEAESCDATGFLSGMNHAYGQSVAYAEAIRIVAASTANLRTPTGELHCSQCAPDDVDLTIEATR